MNVIGHKTVFLSISGALVLASIAAVVAFGFRLGIDFEGGTLWQIRFEETVTKERFATFFTETLAAENPLVTGQGDGSFLIRLREITEADHQVYRERLKELGAFDELRFETIGASVGTELRRRAIVAFFFVLLTISLFIAFAFRQVSRPVRSWKYGAITLLTLFHDAAIPVGLFALLGTLGRAEVDVNFIVAILVVMGFSVHDTIVVFDRIREHLKAPRSSSRPFPDLVNESVNETMVRSVNTSLTLVIVLVALLFLGAPTLTPFVLTILVGTIVGTYSSIFVASPLLTLWRKKTATT